MLKHSIKKFPTQNYFSQIQFHFVVEPMETNAL